MCSVMYMYSVICLLVDIVYNAYVHTLYIISTDKQIALYIYILLYILIHCPLYYMLIYYV